MLWTDGVNIYFAIDGEMNSNSKTNFLSHPVRVTATGMTKGKIIIPIFSQLTLMNPQLPHK